MSCDRDCDNCDKEVCDEIGGASKEAEVIINKELIKRREDTDKDKETLRYIC